MNRPIRYEFVSNFESDETADKECTKYYQICYFPQKNKHQVRKFLIDKNYDYKSVKDHYVSKEKLQQLLMLSDLVKFAKQTPIEVEHQFTLQNAFDFVNGTKREEEVINTNPQSSEPSNTESN